jgi:hypothetical protein
MGGSLSWRKTVEANAHDHSWRPQCQNRERQRPDHFALLRELISPALLKMPLDPVVTAPGSDTVSVAETERTSWKQ